MTKSPEQLDDLINRVKQHADLSVYNKDAEDRGSLNIVSFLSKFPKTEIPQPNLLRIRNQVLDKISLPKEVQESYQFVGGLLRILPRALRISGGIVGAFTIILGLTISTAVAALESVPGQTIYPIKRMVENVQLRLADNDVQKANLRLKFANNRVDEMEAILQKQKEGKVTDEEAQKVVADTLKDIQTTSQTITDQSKEDPNVNLLTKLVTLSDKQVSVISAAQVESESAVQDDLEKALEVSKTTKEQAIENIEKAGLVVENSQPVVLVTEPEDANAVTAEGSLTAMTKTTLSIGTAQFLLTGETEFANITLVDLKIGDRVKIAGEIKDKKTYALKIELESTAAPVEGPAEPAEESTEDSAPPITEPPVTPAPTPNP
jgi:hypothetical protein